MTIQRLSGVDNQVHNDLLKLAIISFDRGDRVVEDGVEGDILRNANLEKVEVFFDECV